MFIGLFLLCSVVDKLLEKYGYDMRQDIQQGNTSKMLPHVIVFEVCRAYYCLFVYGDTQKSKSMFFSCFGLNSCNIFAISSSVSMRRVVTITDLNVYRQHLSSIHKNTNHFSTMSSRCKGNKIIVSVFYKRLRWIHSTSSSIFRQRMLKSSLKKYIN